MMNIIVQPQLYDEVAKVIIQKEIVVEKCSACDLYGIAHKTEPNGMKHSLFCDCDYGAYRSKNDLRREAFTTGLAEFFADKYGEDMFRELSGQI